MKKFFLKKSLTNHITIHQVHFKNKYKRFFSLNSNNIKINKSNLKNHRITKQNFFKIMNCFKKIKQSNT